MSWLSDLIGGAVSGLIPSEVSGIFEQPLPQITAPDITFQPFTVTSGLGGVSAGPSGTAYTLSAQQQAIQDALMGSALGRFQQPQPAGALTSAAAGQQAMALGQQALGATPFGVGQQQAAAQQAFGLGGQFMGAAGAQPADVQALRQQYGGLAGQAAMDVLTPTAAREADVYQRIRATQRPEEERQRLALEERLAQQGRLGVRTAMFGGTPEQFAMAKAQEEAQDRASLAALQQAQAERQQALGTAQTLGGMFGEQATLGGALQAQQAGLGAQYAGLGSSLAAQQQALGAAQQAQALQALTGGQGLLSGGLGLEGAQQQLGIGALQAGYAPQAALLSALSPAINVASLADVARRQQGEFGLEAQIANLQGAIGQQTGLANLYGGVYGSLLSGLGGIVSPFAQSAAGGLFDFIGGIFNPQPPTGP
jgi:hypothetical protein